MVTLWKSCKLWENSVSCKSKVTFSNTSPASCLKWKGSFSNFSAWTTWLGKLQLRKTPSYSEGVTTYLWVILQPGEMTRRAPSRKLYIHIRSSWQNSRHSRASPCTSWTILDRLKARTCTQTTVIPLSNAKHLDPRHHTWLQFIFSTRKTNCW